MKEHILFSKRCKIERMAIEWCVKNNVPTNSFNVVTALCSLGLIESEAAVLTSAMHSDGEGYSVLEKSSIPGDEETFNNGHGW